MNSLLKIQNLNIIHTQSGKTILRDFRISLQRGRIHAVIGESGSGKTTLALLLFKLSHPDLNYYYDVFTLLNREYKDISKKEWLNLRGKNIILIPQNPANAFHPYRKVGVQIKEYFYLKDKKLANKPFILHILEEIGIKEAEEKLNRLPAELSGGERQRILIAVAIALKPDILVADEPTTALDSINEKNTLDLLYRLVSESGIGLLLITHDMRIVEGIADDVTVLKKGEFVENARIQAAQVLLNHPYSKSLFEGSMRYRVPGGIIE